MPLFFSRSHVARLSVLPLGASLLSFGACAHAVEAPDSDQNATAAPQLTSELKPTSTIAASQRPKFGVSLPRRSLMIALPTSTAPHQVSVGVPPTTEKSKADHLIQVMASPSIAQNEGIAPHTVITSAKRIHITSKSRFIASRVSSHTPVPATVPVTTTKPVQATPTPSGPALSTVSSVVPLPAAEIISPRDRMARLPSRGGLAQNRTPIDLQSVPPETGDISESQRRLLAKLDADLGRAQRRLNRAETRLTEGQRQLGNFTGVLRSAMLDAGDDARGLHPFVRVAQRYMGTPYVWGGESARGFDCSGFIMRVMRDLGYKALPHSAAEQFNYGQPVAKSLLKPGDIVFFANTYKPGVSHVGIYLGRNRFIHAANSQDGTIVSGLNEPKWVAHYAGARRLLRVNS